MAAVGGSPWVLALANMLKTMIGSGVLTLPWATAQAGLVLSGCGLLLLAFLSQHAIRLTVQCAACTAQERRSALEELRNTGSVRKTLSTRQTGESSRPPTGIGISRQNSELAEPLTTSSRRESEATVISEAAANDPSRSPCIEEIRLNSTPGSSARPSSPGLHRGTTIVDDGHGCGSWQLIATAAFGSVGRWSAIVSLIVAQFGTCVSYVDFVVNVVKGATKLDALPTVGLVWLGLSLLCLLRPLRIVGWLSAAALICYCGVFGLVVYYGHEADADHQPVNLATPGGLGLWFGPSLFAFEGMGAALSIYESMELTDPAPFYSVVSAAYAITAVLYLFIGSFAYIAWGEGVDRVVLESFPEGALSNAAEIALGLVLAFSFSLQMTPVFHIFENLLHAPGTGWLPPAAWPATRSVIVALAALTGYAVPDMEVMVSLTGAVAFSAIGFVLPGLIYLKLQPEHGSRAARRFDRCVALVLVIFGFVGGSIGLVMTIISG